MQKNMGPFDRGVRFVMSAVVAGLYISGHLTGIPLLLLGTIAVVFVFTGSIGFCPLYLPLGYSTVDGIRLHGVRLSEYWAQQDSTDSSKG